jgi:hypothetical protein
MLSCIPFSLGLTVFLFASTSTGSSGGAKNGEINGFRYQACEAVKCVVVESPRAWLSAANGAFVAEGTEASTAIFRVLKEGKSIREVNATEIVLRPEIGMMTIETATEVLLFDLETYDVETVKK